MKINWIFACPLDFVSTFNKSFAVAVVGDL